MGVCDAKLSMYIDYNDGLKIFIFSRLKRYLSSFIPLIHFFILGPP